MNEGVEFYRHDLGVAELEAVRETLSSLFLTQGPTAARFERAFADWLETPEIVTVSSASMGLVLLLRALGVGPGDEVITTPLTFVATSNAALHLGARVVFADVDPRTGLLCPEAVRAALSPRTRAIVAVHLYGQLADVPRLKAIADAHGCALVEDAAHAVEGRLGDVRPGSHSDGAVFSFYATKTLTCGDGGAVAVRDPGLAAELRLLRNHGITKDAASRYGRDYRHWDMVTLGWKAPLTDLQAAILLPQLERLEARREKREARVRRYEKGLREHPALELLEWHGVSAHHLFTVLAPEGVRDRLLEGLSRAGIGCAVNYRAVHTLEYYREVLGFRPEDFPVAREIGERTLSLPLWPDLPETDVDRVCRTLIGLVDEAVG